MGDFDLTVKIILLGDFSVNKEGLLQALCTLPEEPEVKFLSMRSGMMEMLFVRDGKRVRVKINHTAGQERYRSITSSFYRGVHGCFLLFDIMQRSTFESLNEWSQELHTHALKDDIEVTLAGSNCHVGGSERQVTRRTAQELAEVLGVPYREVSACAVSSLVQALEDMVDRIVVKASRRPSLSHSITPLDRKMLSMQEHKARKSKGCGC